jgi:hypothetical protein
MKKAFRKSRMVSTRLLPVKETSFGVSHYCVRSNIQGAGHPSSTHVNTHSFPADYNHPKIALPPLPSSMAGKNKTGLSPFPAA